MTWAQFLPTFGVLFLVVMARANGTYWIGRGVSVGARRLRPAEEAATPRWRRARHLVHRWGPVAVVLCFLTVGVQTAVNVTAGMVRMPLRRYLPAVTLGATLWATVYATVGLAAARAWLAAASRWPGTVAILAVLLIVGTMGWVWARRARHARRGEGGTAAPEEVVLGSFEDVRS